MGPVYIDYSLNKKQKTQQTILAVLFLLVGIIATYFSFKEKAHSIIIFLVLIYLLFSFIFLIGLVLNKYKKYIRLDTNGIEEKLSFWSKAQRRTWNQMKKITLELTEVKIEQSSGRITSFKLSNLPYDDLKEIKYKIFSSCLDNNISCYIRSKKKF
ncbi:MAG: hypothetical protein LUG18_02140 [Candidatus Azobacteroides sp.]|nr:hypothetical protein [Candidatus Azobacteroides sp.]